MPPHYTHRTNGFLRNQGFSEETAETNMAYSPTRRISGYATDTTDDAICPIFHVRYLGRGPVAAAGRDYVSPIVNSLFRQAARKHLPKTTLFISAQGIRVGQPRGGRGVLPVSFVPIHDCLYGAADRIHKEVFSIVVKGTGRGNPFECMSFVCHKSAHSTALALWLNKAFKEAYEVWQTQTVRPAEPRVFERNVRRNPSFQHQQPRPVEDQYAAYSSVDRGQRRYQRSNSESVYVNGDYTSEPLGDGLYRGSNHRYSATPGYPQQKRKDSEKEGSGFGSFFRRSKRGSERGSREVVYTPPDQDSTKSSPRRSSFSLPDKAPWKKREKRDEKDKKKKEKKKQEDLYTPRGERFVYRNPELSYSVETLDDVSIQSEDRGRSGRRYLRKQRTQSEERELKPPSPAPKRPLSQLLQPTPFTVALEKKASPEPTKKEAQIPKKRTSTEKSLSDERRQPPKKPSPQPTLETHPVPAPPPPLPPAPERREEPKPQQNGEIDFSGIVDTDAFIDDVFDGIDYDIFSDDDQKKKQERDSSEENASEKARDASNKENWPDFSTAYISPTSGRGSQDVPRWTNIFGKTPPPGMSPESGAKFSQYQPKALRDADTDISRLDAQRARQQPTGSDRKRHDSEDDGYTSIVVKENEAPIRYSQALNDYEQSSRSKPNGVINNHHDSKGSGDVKNLYNLVGSKSFWETRVDMGKSMLY